MNSGNSTLDTDEDNIMLPEHLENAFHLMSSRELLIPLIKKLNAGDLLDNFIVMMKLISEGELNADNLPLVLGTERAKFQNWSNTTQMKYCKETLDFWQVVLRQCHRSALLLFSGLEHSGQVASSECMKGYFPPDKSSMNFAVPDPKSLARHQKKYQKQ